MMNDEGLKSEGAAERSPKAGAGAPSGVDRNGAKRFSVERKMAVVARLLRGEPLDLVARQMNVSVAKLTEWRGRALSGVGTAFEGRQGDDRAAQIAPTKSPGCNPRWARSPWTTNCSTPRSQRWRVNALWPTGGRDDEPDALALLFPLLRSGTNCAGVAGLARQRLSLSQGDATEHDCPSPWSGRRMFGCGTGGPYPPANRSVPPSWRGLSQVMGAVARFWGSREPPPGATGDARERLARASSRWTYRYQAPRWDDHHRQGQ